MELAGLDNAEAILQLQYTAYQSEAALYDDPHIPPLTQTLAQLHAEFATHTILKATSDGQLVGSVRAQYIAGTAYIGRLIVEPSRQGQGIGSRLMAAIESTMAPVTRYELFTGDRSIRNIALYQRLGYQPIRQVHLNERVTLIYLEKVGSLGAEVPSLTVGLPVAQE
ncbi:MAG: GNAT family N-acetyltransferase [Oscillochloris sp.]|nr:GNAT family N-acetyltransferase [Oscillochloris sp.]